MPVIRIHQAIKDRLEYLGGRDLSISEVIEALLQKTIPDEGDDDDDDDDEWQTSLFDEDFGE